MRLWVLLCLCGLLCAASYPPVSLVADLPVQHDGRVKPLTAHARAILLTLNGKQTLTLEDGTRMPAEAWLLELLMGGPVASTRLCFNIDNPDVASALGLDWRLQHRWSYREIAAPLAKMRPEIQKIAAQEQDRRDLVGRKLLTLATQVNLWLDLRDSAAALWPEFSVEQEMATILGISPGTYRFTDLAPLAGQLLPHLPKSDTGEDTWTAEQRQALQLARGLHRMNQAEVNAWAVLPPAGEADPTVANPEWRSPWQVLNQQPSNADMALLQAWAQVLDGWRANDETLVSTAAQTLRSAVSTYSDAERLSAEVRYIKADLYTWVQTIAILAGLLLAFGLRWKRLETVAQALLWAAVVAQVVNITARCWIMIRPPVATLYESIIFVAAITAFSGMILSRWRPQLGAWVAVVALYGLNQVARGYADDGDTMGMLVAVLNTNFWLAVHVTTITIGYGAALVTSLAAHGVLLEAWLKPDAARQRAQDRLLGILGVVALLFCIVGTFLGGIWADQSWGRFWGWDPKENGALAICLWLLMLQHARLAGWLHPLVHALGQVVLSIIVVLAWFGVNLLAIGLHSYGFTDSIAINLFIFCSAELVIGGLLFALAWQASQRAPLSHAS